MKLNILSMVVSFQLASTFQPLNSGAYQNITMRKGDNSNKQRMQSKSQIFNEQDSFSQEVFLSKKFSF